MGPRKSAHERREEILAAAMEHFAVGGFHGTSTEAIARAVGISQPYLFRLFRTKKELFLACCERAHARIWDVFQRAAEGVPPHERLERMGQAYAAELLPDRHALLMQMQGYAAVSDPDVQAQVRRRYGELVREVGRLSEAPEDQVWDFFAKGMLLNVVAALDLPAIATDEPWAAHWGA
jgi:AcrR family transcriptional regulator